MSAIKKARIANKGVDWLLNMSNLNVSLNLKLEANADKTAVPISAAVNRPVILNVYGDDDALEEGHQFTAEEHEDESGFKDIEVADDDALCHLAKGTCLRIHFVMNKCCIDSYSYERVIAEGDIAANADGTSTVRLKDFLEAASDMTMVSRCSVKDELSADAPTTTIHLQFGVFETPSGPVIAINTA